MDLRKINSYMILLAIVVVVGLFVSTVARLVILAKGVDAGTANLVFLIMLGTCAIALSDHFGSIFQHCGFHCR